MPSNNEILLTKKQEELTSVLVLLLQGDMQEWMPSFMTAVGDERLHGAV